MKKTIIGGLAAVATAIALLAAPSASADTSERAYLQALSMNAFTVYNPEQTLAAGHTICDKLMRMTGEHVAMDVYLRSPSGSFVDVNGAKLFIVITANNLCPWTYQGATDPGWSWPVPTSRQSEIY
jgi:Protein of unknown function (DUF732)